MDWAPVGDILKFSIPFPSTIRVDSKIAVSVLWTLEVRLQTARSPCLDSLIWADELGPKTAMTSRQRRRELANYPAHLAGLLDPATE